MTTNHHFVPSPNMSGLRVLHPQVFLSWQLSTRTVLTTPTNYYFYRLHFAITPPDNVKATRDSTCTIL